MDRRILGLRPVGNRALLAEVDGLAGVLALKAALVERPQPGLVDAVPADSTVLLKLSSPAAAAAMAGFLRSLELAEVSAGDGSLVEIDVVYDGEDLDAVGELTGLGRDGVVAAHTGQLWTAAFCGFAPGFAYLVGEDSRLEVPRRPSPRTAVPAGSVSLAGTYSAVYPRTSPGGWQLIGRTTAAMWDLDRQDPALVRPGNRVRYRAVRATATLAAQLSSGQASPRTGSAAGPGLLVHSPGLQTLVQDLGRPGFADLGVGASGALDRAAAARANRIAGNPPAEAVLETVYGGLRLEASGDHVLAVSGAVADVTVSGDGGERTAPLDTAFVLRDREVLTLGTPAAGMRSYVAVRGGLDLPPVLGSRATDTLSGLGPAPVSTGTLLGVKPARLGAVVGAPEPQPAPAAGPVVLRIVPGPRQDWFSPDMLDRLCSQDWTVTPQSNRVGLRLEGVALERLSGAGLPAELPSEGTVAGAVQVPPNGLPVLFLADHPVTGGYPVIAVLADEDLDRAAQVPLGGQVRFTVADHDAAAGATPRAMAGVRA